MRKASALLLACLLLAAPAAGAPRAPRVPDARALAPGDRMAPGGRAVLVELAHAEIGTEVDIGRYTSDASYGGGLVGGLILAATDTKAKRLTAIETDKAVASITPLRAALRDLDLAAHALAATRTGLAQAAWFGAGEARLSRSVDTAGRLAAVTDGGQLATVTYRCSLSPDFTQIRVTADVAVWRRAGRALSPLARQRIVAIAQLAQRSYAHGENVARWSADGGAAARAAIADTMARVGRMLPVVLALSPAEIEALGRAKADRVFAAGFYGPRLPGYAAPAGETVIWSQGAISVAPAS